MAATKFTITGDPTQTAGETQEITITVDDVADPGYLDNDVSLTFSGANQSSLDPGPGDTQPTTEDINTDPIDFGDACIVHFTDGIATTNLRVVKAEVALIACTDGVISASGADRLTDTVTGAAAQFFLHFFDTATVVAGAPLQILEIHASDQWGNDDPLYDFPAGKNLTFSNIGLAPDSTSPTITDDTGAAIDLGDPTAVDFNLGVAVTDGTQLDVLFYLAGAGQHMRFTDGTLDDVFAEGGAFLSPKIVDVIEDVLDHFTFTISGSQGAYNTSLGPGSALVAQDQYSNPITTFDASLDNVTVAPDGALLLGAVTGLGSGGNDILDESSDFVGGFCQSALDSMTFVPSAGSASFGSFSATAASSPTGSTGTVEFPQSLVVVLASGQVYGQPFAGVNTITVKSTSNVTITKFNAALDPVTVAADAPLSGVVSGLGSAGDGVLDQVLSFISGVANITGELIFTGTGGPGTFTAVAASDAVINGGVTGSSGSVAFNVGQQGMPIVIDAVMVASYQDGGSAPNNLAIFPRAVFWDNPAAGGDKIRIEDDDGQVLFEATAAAQYDSQYIRLNSGNSGGVKWRDFIVTQMDSGQLFIWYSS